MSTGETLRLRNGPGMVDVLAEPVWEPELDAARKKLIGISENTFCFLSKQKRFVAGVDWYVPDVSRLWRYHLHYFGYVRELMLADVPNGRAGEKEFLRLAGSWLEANHGINGDGWHPYTISLRIVAWLKAALYWNQTWDPAILGSLREQARFLEAQLEEDVRGNHLFENGRALVWLGLCAEGDEAEGWLRRGLAVLGEEVPVQVLEDGCHFERCPGYHFSILLSLVELGCLYELRGVTMPPWLEPAVRKMAVFGDGLIMPDGNYPLLKDSAHDQIPVSPRAVLATAMRWLDHAGSAFQRQGDLKAILYFGLCRESHAPAWVVPTVTSGYCIAHGQGESLVFDAGPPCPSYLPAHAHADTLSFEFHVGGTPLVVDPGVFEYAPGAWRDHFRSTAAHNTVEVDGINSSDVWSSFRVGQRAQVRLLRREQREGEALWLAEHDGFARLAGHPIHRRLVRWRERRWLVIADVVLGRGVHDVESRLHLHPAIKVAAPQRIATGWSANLDPVGWRLLSLGDDPWVLTSGETEPSPQGWYSAAFGEREPCEVVTRRMRGDLPIVAAFVITCDPSLSIRLDENAEGWSLTLDSADVSETCELPGTYNLR